MILLNRFTLLSALALTTMNVFAVINSDDIIVADSLSKEEAEEFPLASALEAYTHSDITHFSNVVLQVDLDSHEGMTLKDVIKGNNSPSQEQKVMQNFILPRAEEYQEKKKEAIANDMTPADEELEPKTKKSKKS